MRVTPRPGRRPIFVMLSMLSAAVAGLMLATSSMPLVANATSLPLIDAVKTADPEAVRRLLAEEVDVNASEADGTTALHWAAHRGDLESLQLLLAAGARPDRSNRYGVAPLALACARGSAPIVEALLNAGADPNASLPEGETVLMAAARTGDVDVLRLLVARGADVGAREAWRGQTALMWAAADNHPVAAQTLVELGAQVNARSNGGWTALLFAVRTGSQEAVAALLEAGANIDDTIRLQPVRPDDVDDAPGASTRRDPQAGTSALVIAVANGHFSLARHLIGRGADPDAADQGWTALHQLAYTRRPNSGKGMPPVPLIDSVDTLTLARFLLENGADPNPRQTKRMNNGERNHLNRVGATPYLLAAKHADVPLMRLLADHGADTTQPTEGTASPLMVAAGVGIWNLGESAGTNAEAFEAVKLAWELGDRDVNQADARGYTALHGAALRGANAIVELLVEGGADLLAQTSEGWTPLRVADGVHYTGTVKRADHTAELLRRLMKEQGVYAAAHEKDVNSVAVVVPASR